MTDHHTGLTLPGVPTNAFDHLAAYGLLAILAAAGHDVRLSWTDTMPHPVLDGVGWNTAAEAVRAHAQRACRPESWVRADGLGTDTSALFSPRIKAMAPDVIAKWYAQRQRFVDESDADDLDLAMIGALGEPSYWNDDHGSLRPDNGASRWEMKTRNRGEEFVTHRLRPLADVVANRDLAAVRDGLSGAALVDELGKNRIDSRTPTGLTSPAPTDNARAWCGLWGISFLPVFHRIDTGLRAEASRTAGHLGNRLRGTLYLPFLARPVPPARLGGIIVSQQLRLAAMAATTHEPQRRRADVLAAGTWLSDRGVIAVAHFPVFRSTNASAPEKWARPGTLTLIDEL